MEETLTAIVGPDGMLHPALPRAKPEETMHVRIDREPPVAPGAIGALLKAAEDLPTAKKEPSPSREGEFGEGLVEKYRPQGFRL